MADISEFKQYLIYNDEGEPIGVRQDSPMDIKQRFREWYIDEQDKIRMALLFEIQA